MSNWYPDTTLGNYPFVGWSMLWAGIVLTLQGAAVWGGGAPDPETGEIPFRRGHDFFWIPVLFWGIGFIGLSIWLINKEPKESFYESAEFQEMVQESTQAAEEEEDPVRLVNFYNPFDDSLSFEMYDAKTRDYIIGTSVPSESTRYKEFDCKRYDVIIGDTEKRITVTKATTNDPDDYNELWYIMGGAADLLLIDVTDACDREITRGELRAINWTDRIEKRYDGDELIEPSLLSTPRKKRTIYGMGDKLPLEHSVKELVYALVPVEADQTPSESYLDEKVIEMCFTDD